jgi:multicomponent K+:H+ antiporter subunit G
MNPVELSLWVEIMVAVLLLVSGALALVGALGLLRLKTFFQRMHAPAVSTSLCIWCVAVASIVYFSARDGRLELQAWLIMILLAITAPITTSLLARAALFRKRTMTTTSAVRGDD